MSWQENGKTVTDHGARWSRLSCSEISWDFHTQQFPGEEKSISGSDKKTTLRLQRLLSLAFLLYTFIHHNGRLKSNLFKNIFKEIVFCPVLLFTFIRLLFPSFIYLLILLFFIVPQKVCNTLAKAYHLLLMSINLTWLIM